MLSTDPGISRRQSAYSDSLDDMIIDSGWDFVLLAQEHLHWSDGSRRLLAILMSDDLGYYGTHEISARYDGDMDAIADEILQVIDDDFIRYFAVVEQCAMIPEHNSFINSAGEWRPPSENLKDRALDRGLFMIGHVFIDPVHWNSTGPMHSFKDYGMSADLPAITITRPERFSDWRSASGGWGTSRRASRDREQGLLEEL